MYEIRIQLALMDTEQHTSFVEVENILHQDLTEEQACNMLDDITAKFKDTHKE